MADIAKPQSTAQVKAIDEDAYLEDDPHRAALEDNPDTPEKLTWSTVLSIFVSESSWVMTYICIDSRLLSSSSDLPLLVLSRVDSCW